MKLRILAVLLLSLSAGFAQHRLDIEFKPVFGDQPLTFDALTNETPSGQAISVTRCDLLLSGASLQRKDGTWLTASAAAAYVSLRSDRRHFTLHNVPGDTYQKLRFNIGLPKALDQADPAKFPAKHPLNPIVNRLHRGQQGGYTFAAIEGLWRDSNNALQGYSYHLATEANLITVEFPIELDARVDRTLHMDLDVRHLFQGLQLDETHAATESRPGDTLAATIRQKLSRSLHVTGQEITPISQAPAQTPKPLVAPRARAFRLNASAAFPQPSLPEDNPLTEEGVFLGERLFHDRRLSGNETQSCASCHKRPEYFSDERRFSRGAFGDIGTRQSMPLFNLAWKSSYFWDGRAPTLREQSLQPIQNPIEMHASLHDVVKHLQNDRAYPRMFQAAFGTRDINSDLLARALEQFLITLVSDDSKFDRSMRGLTKLSPEEQRGAELFNAEYDPKRGLHGADCFQCHGGTTFQSKTFANNGLDEKPSDAGLFIATGLSGDRGKFAVPSLRNVAMTAPYMHDGRFATLEEVIEHYDHGVQLSETLDPNLAKHPSSGLQLSKEDKTALIAFLKTLTDRELARPPSGRGGNFPPNPDFPPGPGFPPPPFPPGPPPPPRR